MEIANHVQHLGDRIPLALQALPYVPGFYSKIFEGKFNPLSPEQVSQLADTFIPSKPLLPLVPSRITQLHRDIAQTLSQFMNDGRRWKVLAGNLLFFNGQSSERKAQIDQWSLRPLHLNCNPILIQQALINPEADLQPLRPLDKKALFTNPEFWNEAELVSQDSLFASEPLNTNGTRSIEKYSISDPLGHLEQVISEVQQRTGRQGLSVLDIGGSNGLAAWELERENPNLNVTNVTLHPEPALYPLRGGHVFVAAEMLPSDFTEQFDLVISNYAFVHMEFPHLALINALMGTSIGGVLDISYGWGGHRFGFDVPSVEKQEQISMLAKETPAVFQWLQELAQDGLIEFRPESMIEVVKTKSGKIPYGRVAINKNGSVTNAHLKRLSELLSCVNSSNEEV